MKHQLRRTRNENVDKHGASINVSWVTQAALVAYPIGWAPGKGGFIVCKDN